MVIKTIKIYKKIKPRTKQNIQEINTTHDTT